MNFTFRRLTRRELQGMISGAALLCVAAVFYLLYTPIGEIQGGSYRLTIQEGSGLVEIAGNLKKAGVIRSKYAFILYIMATGQEGDLKAGTYTFKPDHNLVIVAHIILGGFADLNDVQILLAEGFNIWEIDERLTEFKINEPGHFAKTYLAQQGRLFPDTYRIARPTQEGYDKRIIADAIAGRMLTTYETKTVGLFASLSFEQEERTLIIASMLEKEARNYNDMRLVAGIIEERLKRGMELKIDATVMYGACLREFEESSYTQNCDPSQIGVARELKIDGPYNTYTRKGLPPKPISNPGLNAIKAALDPQDSPYLYYLSTRDTGQIIFSRTGAEHEVNRRKYLGL